MTNKRIRFTARTSLLTVCLTVLLSGCGSSSMTALNSSSQAAEDSYSMSDSSVFGLGNDSAEESAANEDYAYEESYEETGTDTAADEGEEQLLEEGKDHEDSSETGRKLITTVNISVQTKEFDALQEAIETSVTNAGGYIESSEVYYNSYSYYRTADPENYTPHDRSASYVLRIPEKKLDDFLKKLHDGSNVTQESRSVTDITLDYVDTAAHKKALETEAESLEKMLAKAEKLEDIVQIQSRLTEVRYQIDSIESQLRTYDNKVNYSTVRLEVSEVEIYRQPEDAGAWERITTGFRNSLYSVGRGFADFGIWLLVHIPQLIVTVVIVLAVVFVIRKIVRKCGKKAERRREKKRAALLPKDENNVQGKVSGEEHPETCRQDEGKK